MLERTLVLLKPDAVQRGLMGRIISRFEDAGFKIIGTKMVFVDEAFGKKHYEDISQIITRRGEKVYRSLMKYMQQGPVMALCLEGVNAVEQVRKMVGPTEPKVALPGTIRGDFAHVSIAYADQKNIAVKNLIHASGNLKEAELEIALWFKKQELHSYKSVHDQHIPTALNNRIK